ncbi:hypothetical protein D3C71_2051840 [compost metagenome]
MAGHPRQNAEDERTWGDVEQNRKAGCRKTREEQVFPYRQYAWTGIDGQLGAG